jgi:prephenate dehydrogenase/chorismate mutase/prephenate dehydrogenase
MDIFILGNKGRMGSYLTNFLREKGFNIKGLDIISKESENMEREMKNSDVLILAIPQDEALKFVREHENFTNIMEIGSVKSIFKDFAGKIVSIHPLFGPISEGPDKQKRIIFIDDISPAEKKDLVLSLFGDIDLIGTTADKHDRIMADVLVAPYIISLISSRINPGSEFMTRSSQALDCIADISKLESMEVLRKTIFLNPYSMSVIRKIKLGIDDLEGELL